MVSFNSMFWGGGQMPGLYASPAMLPPILAGIDQQFGLMPNQATFGTPLGSPLFETAFIPKFQQLGMASDPYAMGNWQMPVWGAFPYKQPWSWSVVDETMIFLQALFAQTQAQERPWSPSYTPGNTAISSSSGGVQQPQIRQTPTVVTRTPTQVSKSGGSRQDAVEWARSQLQLGISERSHPDQVRWYSKGRWQAWCADFTSTALEQTGGSPWGHRSSVADIRNWAAENGRLTERPWETENGKLTKRPKIGDAFLQSSNGKKYGHIGLIEEIKEDGTIIGIAGNTKDAVRRMTFRPGDSSLVGFVDTA